MCYINKLLTTHGHLPLCNVRPINYCTDNWCRIIIPPSKAKRKKENEQRHHHHADSKWQQYKSCCLLIVHLSTGIWIVIPVLFSNTDYFRSCGVNDSTHNQGETIIPVLSALQRWREGDFHLSGHYQCQGMTALTEIQCHSPTTHLLLSLSSHIHTCWQLYLTLTPEVRGLSAPWVRVDLSQTGGQTCLGVV